MDRKLNEFNKLYNKIKIPENLDNVINNAVNKAENKKVVKLQKPKKLLFKRLSTLVASLVLLLGLTVNTSYVFAQGIYKIPVIGELAKMITFREYTIENETSIGEVKIPKVKNVDNKMVENFINKTINEKINQLLKEQAILDAEYKEAYLETGGKEEDYRKIETKIDYKLYYVSENVISFEITKSQTLASAYNEKYFYNIYLKTADEITLKDVLGENFVNLIKDSVEKEMKNRMKKDPNIIYDLDYFKEMEINEKRNFYIKENGDIVVVFAKYEVACGSMGQQDFIVGSIKNKRFPDEVTIIGEEIFSADARFINSISNTITLNINQEKLILESMQQYDFENGELLKVKYVLEDGKKPVLLQCYPASNRIELSVENLNYTNEGKVIIVGKNNKGINYSTSIDKGVKVNSYKENLEIGDRIEIYYDYISDDEVKHILPYVINQIK